jgi:predicted transcriptional regulator
VDATRAHSPRQLLRRLSALMSATKVLSLRLPSELAEELGVIARAEGVSVSAAIRASVYRYIATRRTDQDFQERIKQRLEADREVLERLAS